VQKNIDALAGLLQLNPAERALLLYGTLARYQRDLRGLLVEFKVSNAQEAYAAWPRWPASSPRSGRSAARRLAAGTHRHGGEPDLRAQHHRPGRPDEGQRPAAAGADARVPRARRADGRVHAPVAPRASCRSDDFAFVAEDAAMLTALLRNATPQGAGVNVLLYGPPGTGKTELAKVCAQAAGLSLYEVEYADRDGNSLSGRDRYRSLQISQVFLKGSAQAVALLFDEVEDVFPPISSEAAQLMARAGQQRRQPAGVNSSVSGKAWVNQILETNPVPVIWVTNRIEQIDPAFRRRFQYHLMLKSPPPGAR
jgi:hypothetical protein